MAITLPLKEMTVPEKLAVMETLWQDLSQTPETVRSPGWHNKVLGQRRRRIAAGTARFEDWVLAKARIRKKLK